MINCHWKENPIKTLDDVIDVLRMAARQGANEDKPEGTRYVVFSDTLLNQVVASLIQIKEKA